MALTFPWPLSLVFIVSADWRFIVTNIQLGHLFPVRALFFSSVLFFFLSLRPSILLVLRTESDDGRERDGFTQPFRTSCSRSLVRSIKCAWS